MGMNRTRNTIACLAGLLLAAAASAAPQDETPGRISRTVRVGRDGSLEVSNVSGDIVISAGSGDEIQIEAVKRPDSDRRSHRSEVSDVDVEIKEIGNRVSARAIYRSSRSVRVAVYFTITAPRGTAVTAKSVSGNIRVDKIEGELRAESVSGSLKLVGTNRVALAKSVSGDVEVTGATREENYLSVSSVSGDVVLAGVSARELEAESVSGDVSIMDANCQRVSIGSVSGDVTYSGSLAPGGRYEFKSHSGDVELVLASKTGFEFEGKTFSGEIQSALPLTVSELRRGKMLRGVYGDGAAYLSATSFSGDIELRQK